MLCCITNLIGDNAGNAKIIIEKVPNLLQILYDMILGSSRMSKRVLLTIMWCFEALLDADVIKIGDLNYLIPILMFTLRLEDDGDEVRSNTLRLFAKLSDTHSEEVLAMLSSGNTVETLMDSWSSCIGMDPSLER